MKLEKSKGIIVEILYDKYIIMTDDEIEITIIASIKGTLRKTDSKIFVGDIVDFEKNCDQWIITGISERKNSIIRPSVCNIDQMILMLSIDNPTPDYLLLDKELALCFSRNIKPIICVNKLDLIKDDYSNNYDISYIDRVYKNIGIDVIYTSVKQKENLDELENILKGNITAFSGNSGVGKSSLTQYLLDKYENKFNIEIGELSDKINKGKHTTKYVRLYVLDKDSNTYILDTPGFSSYELYDIEYRDLKVYYPDFSKYTCKYLDCSHVNEALDECEIKRHVELGPIDKDRYERYILLYNNLKQLDNKKYK